jgi:hypothetical protein
MIEPESLFVREFVIGPIPRASPASIPLAHRSITTYLGLLNSALI